jgi:hypothetical protein
VGLCSKSNLWGDLPQDRVEAQSYWAALAQRRPMRLACYPMINELLRKPVVGQGNRIWKAMDA